MHWCPTKGSLTALAHTKIEKNGSCAHSARLGVRGVSSVSDNFVVYRLSGLITNCGEQRIIVFADFRELRLSIVYSRCELYV